MINLRLALRALFKSPFLTSVAIVSLALGIGANAAIYSLFDQLLRRPMQLEGHDVVVLVAAAVVLSAVALGAGFLPARRASKIEPMRALRYE